jgi:N-acetylmuramoyl-L-alanine amidase
MRWTESPVLRAYPLALAIVLVSSPPSSIGQTGAISGSALGASPQPPAHPSLILIDAAHGGSDTGALLNPAIPEKDVNLVIARRLRQELSARGIQSSLLRDGDSTVTVDQRAGVVNSLNPGLYLCIHSTSQGSGMRVYSSVLPVSGGNYGGLANWQTAQTVSIPRSRWVQQQIFAAIQKTGFPVRSYGAPLRPLNNITAPAVAIEISPTTSEVSQLASPDYQQMICAALANALTTIAAALRDRNMP